MRSLMRRLAAFTSPELFSDGERAAAEDLIQACTLVHGWIMTSYLRGGLCRSSAPIDEMQEALLRAALGVEEEAEEGGGGEARTDAAEPAPAPSPYLWISATAMGVSQRLPGLTDQERIAMDDLLTTVAADLAKCEKLVSTPIPLGYTRSSVRFLWIWITLLPFALSRTFADFQAGTWWEDKPLAELPVLLTTMLFISFIFLSIEDTHTHTRTHTHTHTHTASPTRTGPCPLNAVGLLSSRRGVARVAWPLAPPPRACGEVYLTLPHLTPTPTRPSSSAA